jgi:hypothetical protein
MIAVGNYCLPLSDLIRTLDGKVIAHPSLSAFGGAVVLGGTDFDSPAILADKRLTLDVTHANIDVFGMALAKAERAASDFLPRSEVTATRQKNFRVPLMLQRGTNLVAQVIV